MSQPQHLEFPNSEKAEAPPILHASISIHSLHSGAYLQCSSWLIAAPGGLIIVDPGAGAEDQVILARLSDLGYTRADVRAVLLTHAHCDHALGIPFWQQHGTVVASAPTAAWLREANPAIWGEHPELLHPIEVDQEVSHGDTLAVAGVRINVVATPGHTPGCITYVLETNKRMEAFTGDLLMKNGQPGWAGKGQYQPEKLMASLQRLGKLNLKRIYPGHGEPIDDVTAWIEKGLALGRSGQWHPPTHWQTMDVPEAFS